MPSRRPSVWAIVVSMIVFAAVLGYVGGYRAGHVQPDSGTTSPAVAPIDIDTWVYPGARPESSGGGGSSMTSTSRMKEMFPGGRYVGASKTVTDTQVSTDLESRTDTTADPLEKVYAYYAKRLQVAGAGSAFQPGTVSSMSAANGGANTQVQVVNSSPSRSDVKTALLTSTDSTGSLAVLLSRGRSEQQTTITLLGFTAPVHTTTAIANPPVLPGLSH